MNRILDADEARRLLIQIAHETRYHLLAMGLGDEMPNGTAWPVDFNRLSIDHDGRIWWGAMQIDLVNLPAKAKRSPQKLISSETMHNLNILLGRPVYRMNTTGASYAVELEAQGKKLPKSASFDLQDRPAGPYQIPIGYGYYGAEWRSLMFTSHILVGGESRSGKTTWLNAMLVSLLLEHKDPTLLKLALIDPKDIEFVH